MSTTANSINEATDNLNKALRKKEIYDPRIIELDNSNIALWNSESVELANKGIIDGYRLKDNPYLKTVKGVNIRKAYLPFKYTQDELEILSICGDDKEFFCDNFGKLKDGDKGWSKIELYNYQRNLLKKYTENRWNIIMFPRQSGKTTTTILEIIHFAIFNIDKDMVVIAQSEKVINEILGKIKEAFSGLPFFMQPGFISFNKTGFTLDNGCRLTIGIASESVVQGFSLDFLYIDEFAYIKPSLVEKFWNNIYPTLIKNENSKCIITSTPNGRNKFWQLWVGAETRANRFKSYRIYWYDTPGRDEQFKLDTIANVGIEAWEMGFECSFDTHLKSIFHSKLQMRLRELQNSNESYWSMDNNPIGREYGISFISQDIVKYDLKQDYFLVGIDLGEGLSQDDTTLKIKKIEWDILKQRLVFKSVGVFNSNTISVEDFAEMNIDLLNEFDKTKIKVIVENNTYGGEYFAQIDNYQINGSSNLNKTLSNDVFAQFHRKSKNGYEKGLRWDMSNKKLAVKSFSNLIDKEIMVEYHFLSIEEYLNFGRQKNGTYSAQYGHDDLVMADVSISYFIKSNNIFNNAFLKEVENQLRYLADDEAIEVRQKKEEIKRKEASIYTYNGFNMRNHNDYAQPTNDDIFLFST